MVEITGFSEAEVKEYIEKYFRKDVAMKNTVLEHITKNENLVSFAHIPVLCALMCSYMEYMIKETNNTEDLPVSTSELYFEVLNIFELIHNKSTSSHFDETTLDKLSEFAARLLLERKFLFSDEEMKKLTSEEVESLRKSGLLHCGPSFRVSFSQTAKHHCFTHLTLHEYLAARWFVKRRDIPATETVSGMVLQFMAGILSKEKDSELMKTLLIGLLPVHEIGNEGLLLLEAKCLYEYQDEVLAKDHYRQYPFHDERLAFSEINDVDCIAISFCLDILSALNAETPAAKRQTLSEQPLAVVNEALLISRSNLTMSGVKRVCKSLEKDFSVITKLSLFRCQITDGGVVSLCEALKHSSCKVTTLHLRGNQITDAGVVSLCEALKHPNCKVTTVNLIGNQITDAGVVSLCEALKHSSCKVTTLDLGVNQITDDGVVSLCEALKHPSCKVTIRELFDNQITDAGVVSLCEALKHSSCKVTTLDLIGNQITDDGVVSLCEALKHPSCEITTLHLSRNQITDDGVVNLCEALKHSSCEVTTLDLGGNQITDAGVVSLCEALKHPNCKVTTLHLSGNQITDAGVVSLCEALKHPSCKVTTLHLSGNQMSDDGVVSLCEALKHPNCKVTALDLPLNYDISGKQKESIENTLKQRKPYFELIYLEQE